ncbi:hypothetical protein AB0M50_45460, partial [Nonomuraea fuscirosea]|uniref:hypothetical protein n=1 Tax=Nonomuraea fuscirosea TaxID=1291556 RepID=UPI00341CCA7B
GDAYRLLGLIPSDIHLIGPVQKGAPFFLLGSSEMRSLCAFPGAFPTGMRDRWTVLGDRPSGRERVGGR